MFKKLLTENELRHPGLDKPKRPVGRPKKVVNPETGFERGLKEREEDQ